MGEYYTGEGYYRMVYYSVCVECGKRMEVDRFVRAATEVAQPKKSLEMLSWECSPSSRPLTISPTPLLNSELNSAYRMGRAGSATRVMYSMPYNKVRNIRPKEVQDRPQISEQILQIIIN